MRPCQLAILPLTASVAASVRAELVSSDFDSFPTNEGWEITQQYCEPITWAEDGLFFQLLDFHACPPPPPPGGAQEDWVRWINDLNGIESYFFEFRVQTDAPVSDIPGGAPTVLTAFNGYGISYHVTVANDEVLLQDAWPHYVWLDVQPDIPHTVRLELRNGPINTYQWYVDNVLVDEGDAAAPYPSQDARIAWRGKANWQPCFNKWSYIRYGYIPQNASGDITGEGRVDGTDFYFFAECVDRSAAGEPAVPSCAWADMNGDGTVDCTDWDLFRDAWTDTDNPPPFLPACVGNAIPATSDWGLTVLALLVFTIGTLTFRRARSAT